MFDKDIFQIIGILILLWASFTLSKFNLAEKNASIKIILIKTIEIFFLSYVAIFGVFEYVASNQPVILIDEIKLNELQNTLEVTLKNNSKSFGTNVKFEFIALTYEGTKEFKNFDNFTHSSAPYDQYYFANDETSKIVIESPDYPKEIPGIKPGFLLYVYIENDVPFLPFVKNKSKHIFIRHGDDIFEFPVVNSDLDFIDKSIFNVLVKGRIKGGFNKLCLTQDNC